MLVRKACIQGNCRVHDVEMMQDIILEERRPPDTRPHDYTAKRDDSHRLTMVGSATARRYRAMGAHVPLDRAAFEPHPVDKFTDEEKRRWRRIIGQYGFAAVAENVSYDAKAVSAAEIFGVGLVEA